MSSFKFEKSVIELPSAHRRSLSAVARSIEQSLSDILTLLSHNHSTNVVLHQIVRSYSKPQCQKIIAVVEAMQGVLKEVIHRFNLDTSTITDEQILHAKCTHIWSMLHDSYSEKMLRYGELNKEAEIEIDSYINKMLELLAEIQYLIETGSKNEKK